MKGRKQQEVEKALTQKSRWNQMIAMAKADGAGVRASEAADSLDVVFQEHCDVGLSNQA
jgi:hypothetical protein